MKNILFNGNMNISQRKASFSPAVNNLYILDRFKFLSSANGVVAQTSGGPTGSNYYMAVKNGTANNQTAVVQIVEKQNAIAIIGSVASLSFQAKAGATPISNLRVALLGWTGTADGTVSATIISSWGSNGTNPTWGTNFIMLNVPSNLALSGAWQTFKIENIAIPSNANNLAVVIWTDDGIQASGAEWDLAQVQLEYGSVATSFEIRPIGIELMLCQRYYEKGLNFADYPGTAVIGFKIVASQGTMQWWMPFKVPKRIAPTTQTPPTDPFAPTVLAIFSSKDGAVDNIQQDTGSTNVGVSSLQTNEVGFDLFCGVATAGYQYSGYWTVAVEL